MCYSEYSYDLLDEFTAIYITLFTFSEKVLLLVAYPSKKKDSFIRFFFDR